MIIPLLSLPDDLSHLSHVFIQIIQTMNGINSKAVITHKMTWAWTTKTF